MRSRKTWTQEEIDFLIDHWGEGKCIKFLAGRMKRSVEGVMKKARKLKLGPYLNGNDDITYADFARAFGLYASYHWHKEKLVKAGLPIYEKQLHTKTVAKVKFKKFWQWAEKNKGMLDWSKLEKNILGEEPAWVDEQRKMDYLNRPTFAKKWTKAEHENLKHYRAIGLSVDEISARLNRTASAIERRCYDYYLDRPKVIEKRTWTEEEIKEIVRLKSEGWNFRNIAEKVGRSERSIRGKIYDVTLKRGRAYIDLHSKKCEHEPNSSKSPRKWTEEELGKAITLREQGWNYRQIGEAIGRAQQTVRSKVVKILERTSNG
jgi:hypothetical protein